MIHGNSKVFGKPNSSFLITESLKHNIDIIELDVRKSKDGILYCYHGGLSAFFLKYFSFQFLENKLQVEKLEDVLIKIKMGKIIFLDIKGKNIGSKDFQILSKYNLEFWLAGYNLKYLNSLKRDFGSKFSYIYNFSFFNFKRGLEKAKKFNIDTFKIFWWQCNDKNIELLKKNRIAYVIHPWLMSKEKYDKLLGKYGSLWVALDDPRKPDKLLMQI